MTPRAQVLIVDDEPAWRETLSRLLETEGYAPFTANDGLDALALLSQVAVPLVIADIKMPRMDGLALLREIERRALPSTVVVLTGWGDIRTAVEAMRLGAYDYLTKPVDPNQLLRLLAKLLEAQPLRAALAPASQAPTESAACWKGMVGACSAMREVFDLIQRVAPSKAHVFIRGETGTGKELVARAIHELSGRSAQPFVAVNSAALPADLLESELFGYEPGTGGDGSRKEGCFELVRQGTLFLEEVADIPPATQAKLVRVLEGHPYGRLGGAHELRAGARIITATNRDIDRMLGDGRFRPDLFFRLGTVEIRLPALRDRGKDIPLLIRVFLRDFNRVYAKGVRKVSSAAMDRLLRHPWPGNVRELRHAIERAVILAEGDTLTLEDLPPTLREPERLVGSTEGLYLCSIDEMERRLILEALARLPTRARAAEVLGVSPRTLYNRIRRYGLDGRVARPGPAMPGGEGGREPASRRTDPLSRTA